MAATATATHETRWWAGNKAITPQALQQQTATCVAVPVLFVEGMASCRCLACRKRQRFSTLSAWHLSHRTQAGSRHVPTRQHITGQCFATLLRRQTQATRTPSGTMLRLHGMLAFAGQADVHQCTPRQWTAGHKTYSFGDCSRHIT
jgi:hypothetical protein